ncbi:MAG: nucleotidyltransferase family protein [Oscillospiraceae bacterium]|nr:nucleotidyltransferase family protein [Oscillospiraceae bacterium]
MSDAKKLENFSYLLKLLSCALNDTKIPQPNECIDWALVFSLAKSHSVAGMAYCAIKKHGFENLPPKNVLAEFKEYYEYQLLTDFNVDVETEDILREMAEKKLYAMPLKGYLLKHDYPVPAMRTMSDVDILYKESQQEAVKALFLERGYSFNPLLCGEMEFSKGEFHHYELQANLCDEDRASYDFFSNIWERVSYTDGYRARMSLEDYYLYLLEHLAFHFENGGVGLRMFMDVYVFMKKHGKELDEAYLTDSLNKLKLKDFRVSAEKLGNEWFCDNSSADLSSPITEFIMDSQTYGRLEYNIVMDTVRREEKIGKRISPLKNLLCKIFPNYSYIAKRYPIAQKHKILYPFCIVRMWVGRIFARNINTKGIKNYLIPTDSDIAKSYKAILTDMGLGRR